MNGRSGGLYLAWRLEGSDDNSAQEMKDRLTEGENRHLYRLCSWVVTGNEAQALLTPSAPLEDITEAIWRKVPGDTSTFRAKWVWSARGRAELTREIETAPVHLGLARRPEEWPYSSAAID